MDTFRGMAAAVRHKMFQVTVRQNTQKLDPIVRIALVDDTRQDVSDLQQEFFEAERELEQSKLALKEMEQKETFLGQRWRQYRLALDERARMLRDEQRELKRLMEVQRQAGMVDEEENLEEREELLEVRMEKWERDEDALAKVVETHKVILAECERMRRTIMELEQKRNECRVMSGEVGEFILAAVEQSAVEQDAVANDATGAVATGHETEMSNLVSTNRVVDEEQEIPRGTILMADDKNTDTAAAFARNDSRESELMDQVPL